MNCSYDYGTTFWKIKGGFFTCKCGKTNCSFSEETIKSLHIDSDNEEVELDGNIKKIKIEKNNLTNNELLNQDMVETNKSNTNLLNQETKLSKSNNLLGQNTNLKELSIIKSKPENGLLENKSINLNVDKNKEENKNIPEQLLKKADDHSKKILESNLIPNKRQVVLNMLDKKLVDNMVKGNACQLLINKKKSSIETVEKGNIFNSSKVISELVKLSKNKAITTYVLRPKITTPCIYENKRAVGVSTDNSSFNQKMTQKTSINQLMKFIKAEPIFNDSKTEMNMINGEHQSVDCLGTLYTSEKEALNVKHNSKIECFPHSN